MKKIVSILTILFFSIIDISSQSLLKMIINDCDRDPIPTNICKNENLGIIVFFSAIENLEFEAISPKTGGNAIVSIKYENSYKAYILCVKPQEEPNFSVNISANRFYPETCVVGSIKAKEKKIFMIISDDKTVEITVFGKDGQPLENALLEIKGKPTEHTNSVGYSKIELPNSEAATLFISHELYKDKKAISVSPGDKQTVRLVIPITVSSQNPPPPPPPPKPSYPPFYLAVTAGVSTFGSVSLGSITNGGSGVFGADIAYFFNSSSFGMGLKLNVGMTEVDFGNSFSYNEMVMFAGPALYGRWGKGAVAFTSCAGVGILNWKWNVSESGNTRNYDPSSAVGGFLSAGVNYMFTKNVGIGLNVQSILGSVKDDDGYERKPTGIGATLGFNFRF